MSGRSSAFAPTCSGKYAFSAITYAELRYGVENSARTEENLERLERFLLPLEIVSFTAEGGRGYGRVRTQLQRAGLPSGGNELLLAAHAISLGVTLVTGKVLEFERVEGLHLEQWV